MAKPANAPSAHSGFAHQATHPAAGLSGRPVKHSLTLRGHRTSVSLESAFWQAFRKIATAQGVTLNQLATRIDESRGDIGLASAIRVFVLQEVQARPQATDQSGQQIPGTDRMK